MPPWGLTGDQRDSQPWGIEAELLKPGKTLTDPVHGEIHLTRLETLIVDSPPIQRLRRIRQLGTTHLTYPGATHTRFSHCLGTLRAAQDLLDALYDNFTGPHPAGGLLTEWGHHLPPSEGRLSDFDRRWAEATVLTRLGALLHDLGHVPLGHTVEDDLELLLPHDANWPRLKSLWEGLDDTARDALENSQSDFAVEAEEYPSLVDELWPLILPKLARAQRENDGQTPTWLDLPDQTGERPPVLRLRSYPFVEDLVGNTICADLLDYIHRDHKYTGLPFAVGSRFTRDFYVAPSSDRRHPQRMVIRTHRDGKPRRDVITELVKVLRFRYELTERALAHHSKVAADAMLDKLIYIFSQILLFQRLIEQDGDVEAAMLDTTEHFELRDRLEQARVTFGEHYKEAHRRRQHELESLFLRHGDDGLLEKLAGLPVQVEALRPQVELVTDLASSILERRLYKVLGRSSGSARLVGQDIYNEYGRNASQRRALEAEVAQIANVNEEQVALWIPNPDMRLKVADVLIDSGEGPVAALGLSNPDAKYLTQRHKELWCVTVLAAPEVQSSSVKRLVMSYVGNRLQIDMIARDGEPVPDFADVLTDEIVEHLAEEMPESISRDEVHTVVDRRLGAAQQGGAAPSAYDIISASVDELNSSQE